MPFLLTEAEAKQAIGGGLPPTLSASDQAWLTDAIAALTPVIEEYAGPIILRSVTAYASGGRTTITLPWMPYDILSIKANGVTVDPAGYYLDGGAGIVTYGAPGSNAKRWPGGRSGITVTALVGLESTPPNIKLAAKELIRFWWQQGRQGSTPWAGADQGTFQVPQGFAMPNRVIALIRSGTVNMLPGFA